MDRGALKFDAKTAMREAAINPYVVTVIMMVITVVLSVIQSSIDMWGELITGSHGITELSQVIPYVVTTVIFFVVTMVVSVILEFGYQSFCLKVADRDSSMSYMDLFSGVKYFFKALGLSIMVSIFVVLWTLLFIIPGIIAAYRYSQAVFIMVEHPEKGIMQCIRESKEMMKGHKWEYFVLELSFILWNLLGLFTCGIALIYVYPYTRVTMANYYNHIKPKAVEIKQDVVTEW